MFLEQGEHKHDMENAALQRNHQNKTYAWHRNNAIYIPKIKTIYLKYLEYYVTPNPTYIH